MLRELVEELARAVAAFERVRKVPSFFPLIFLAFTIFAAFAPWVEAAVVLAAVGGAAAWRGRGLREWVVVTSLSLAFALVVSLPALLGLLEAKADVVLFIARAASSSAVLTGGLLYCGWASLVESLRYVAPRPFLRMLELLPVQIYSLGRTAVVVAAAREARTPKFDKMAFAAAVGDILIYGIERGRALRMAYEARSP
ncbi:cobalt transporter [Pyrobaculum sp. 3827-6]|uniref:cobalt transporter n=1 Tax=Pyrobaculum sp. 3827-6 TaxID=2983604 RepID=UPI0021D8DC7C|nr:cobalt transporter [Pyrobaculum sp. 3827-6]MCU7787553.1 cobalt transporter [Pyrobaculum sp. 3827-6]